MLTSSIWFWSVLRKDLATVVFTSNRVSPSNKGWTKTVIGHQCEWQTHHSEDCLLTFLGCPGSTDLNPICLQHIWPHKSSPFSQDKWKMVTFPLRSTGSSTLANRGEYLIDTLKSDHNLGWFQVSESCKSFYLASISVRYDVPTQFWNSPPITPIFKGWGANMTPPE